MKKFGMEDMEAILRMSGWKPQNTISFYWKRGTRHLYIGWIGCCVADADDYPVESLIFYSEMSAFDLCRIVAGVSNND